MTILICYDNFTQYNKELAEHQFTNCVLELFSNTSLDKLRTKTKETKQNLQRQVENEAIQEDLSFFYFSKKYMSLRPNKLGNIFCRLRHLEMFLPVCWSEWGFNAALPSGWEVWVLFQTWIIFMANFFLGFCLSVLCLFCMGVFSRFAF